MLTPGAEGKDALAGAFPAEGQVVVGRGQLENRTIAVVEFNVELKVNSAFCNGEVARSIKPGGPAIASLVEQVPLHRPAVN